MAQSYESRFGTSSVLNHEPASPVAAATPRASKKPGVTTFTSASNPFGRTSLKKPSQLEEAKHDAGRAGARTRNAGVMTMEPPGGAAAASSSKGGDQVRMMFSPDYKAGKMTPVCPESKGRLPRGFASQGMAEVLGSSASGGASPASTARQSPALSNYLNDMKRSGRARRGPPNESPASLQGQTGDLFDTKHGALRRAASVDFGSSRRTFSVGSDCSEDGVGSSPYKPWRRQSSVNARGKDPVLLHHINLGEGTATTVGSPPTPHGERQRKNDKRFEEVCGHMKTVVSSQRAQAEVHRKTNQGNSKLLHNEQVVKYEV